MERKPYKNAVENRQYIIFALAEIMKTKPFHEICVTEVCKKAGVSKNTFYRHFENLSDVIYQAIGEINKKLMEDIFATGTYDYSVLINLTCKAWYENRRIFEGFTQDEVIYIIRGFMHRNSIEYRENFTIENKDYEILFEYSSTVLCMFLRWWSQRDFSDPPEKVEQLITDCMCGNIFEKLGGKVLKNN